MVLQNAHGKMKLGLFRYKTILKAMQFFQMIPLHELWVIFILILMFHNKGKSFALIPATRTNSFPVLWLTSSAFSFYNLYCLRLPFIYVECLPLSPLPSFSYTLDPCDHFSCWYTVQKLIYWGPNNRNTYFA